MSNVFRSWSCTRPIRHIILRENFRFIFSFHLYSHIHVDGSQGQSNLTSVRHCVELRLSHERTVKLWSADPDFTVRAPICATNPVVIFLEIGSTSQSVHCDLVNEFLFSESSCGFRLPDKISCCALQWNNVEVPWFRSVSGPHDSLFAPSIFCLGPNATVSHRLICIVVLIHS